MDKVIAERKLMYARKGDAVLTEMTIKIGIPYWSDEVAYCPLEFEGLFDTQELSNAPGADLIQALQLAANVDYFLEKLSAKYDFYWPTGEPYFDNQGEGEREGTT